MSRTALLVQTLIVVILGSLAAWVVLRAKQGPRPERLAPKLMAAPAHDQPVGESPPPTPDQADKDSAQHFLAAAQAANAGHEPWVTPAGAVNRICAEMVEGLAEGPVTAIWLFDRTESAERLRSDVSAELGVALGNVAQLPVRHGRHSAKPAVQDAAARAKTAGTMARRMGGPRWLLGGWGEVRGREGQTGGVGGLGVGSLVVEVDAGHDPGGFGGPPSPKELPHLAGGHGGELEHFLDVKLAVSESRFTNWPPTLQQEFAAARTVEPGKPSFTLSLDSE